MLDSEIASSLVNPYKLRVEEFPGRLFSNIDVELPQFSSLLNGEVFLELGSGSGQHLIAQAQRLPHARCVGMELRYKRSVRTLEKAGALSNIFVLRAHIHRLREFFPAESVSGVWVNFPDPWEKRPKNRILRPRTLREVIEILRPGGFLSFKTDHLEFFDTVHGQIVNETALRIERLLRAVPELTTEMPDNIPTEFEQLFRSKGIAVSHLLARKP